MTQTLLELELEAELLSMRTVAYEMGQDIDRILNNLSEKRELLREIVKEYSAKRLYFFKQKLKARGLTWCTYCTKVFSEEDAELLLIEGREQYTHGYGDSYSHSCEFSKLHRACPECQARAADKHGLQREDKTAFFAFRVEERGDGYYARKFGEWVELAPEKCSLDEPSSEKIEGLAAELALPARIEVELEWPGSRGKLIIHEE